jgi:hypothetical protein
VAAHNLKGPLFADAKEIPDFFPRSAPVAHRRGQRVALWTSERHRSRVWRRKSTLSALAQATITHLHNLPLV